MKVAMRFALLSAAIIVSEAFSNFKNPHRAVSCLYSGRQNFDSLTVPELKDELRSRKLKVGGKKSELIDRLHEYKTSQDDSNESIEDEATTSTPKNVLMDSETASFDELGIMPELLISIKSQQWEDPTPIQRLVIPEIINNFKINDDKCSLWAEAPTGSGKTGAFAIPMVQLTLENRKIERNRSARQQNDYIEQGNTFQRNAGRKNWKSENSRDERRGFVSTLILCPTRELAMQIGGVAEEIVEAMPTSGKEKDNVEIMVITGGCPREEQVQMLAEKKLNNRNVDILIATPGRLADVLLRSTKEDSVEKELENKLLLALDQIGGKNDASLSLAQLDELDINKGIAEGDDGGRSAIKDMLSNVQYLVLDEADRLLSQGFKSEMDDVLKLLPRVGQSIHNDASISPLKTLLFSATFPEQIQPRVEKVLHRLGGKGAPPPLRLSCSTAGSIEIHEKLSNRQQKRKDRTTQPQATLEGPESTITLRSIRIDEQDKTQALRRLLSQYGDIEWDRVLVFVSTRYASEHVARKLRRYNIKSSELHGKLDQDARIRRLDDFKKGKIRVLIATDLASRGLDVQGLPAVVNYDLPRSTADFTHRIGRTGRAGNEGTAITFITSTNEAHYNLIETRHLGKNSVEREMLAGFEPNESKWELKQAATTVQVDGVKHSQAGRAHDQMFGGIKGRKKSKKDRLREKAAREAAKNNK